MFENSVDELGLLKQQLERIKQHDWILAEIEMQLNKMRKAGLVISYPEKRVGSCIRSYVNVQNTFH